MKNNKINLAFSFHCMSIGGVQRKIIDLINHLNQNKSENLNECFLFLDYENKQQFSMLDQVKLKTKQIIIPKEILPSISKRHWPTILVWTYYTLTKDIDVFLSHVLYPSVRTIIAAKLIFWKKIRVIISQDNIFSLENPSKKDHFWGKFAYPLAEKIIVQNRVAKKDLIDYLGISADKIAVIPNWCLDGNAKNSKTKKYDLIYLGRLVKQKNLFSMIDLVKIIKEEKNNIKLAIVGDGEEKSGLKEYVRKLNLEKNVFFISGTKNVKQYYADSKILILTSKFEGQPMVMLEAMNAGLPVVSLNYPGLKLYLKDKKTGYIANSLEKMATTILFLLKNKKARQAVAQRAQIELKEKYSEKNLLKYLDLLSITFKKS